VKYRLLPESESNHLRLEREGILIYEGDSEAELADVLLGSTGHDLADRSRGGLLFMQVLFPGWAKGFFFRGIAAGKTTLTLWLVAKD